MGEAGRGEIVYVTAADPATNADGLTWYRVVADPNEVGWVAGHGPRDQLLRSDAPSASLTWCGVPSVPSFLRAGQQLLDEVVVAGLPVQSSLLGLVASSAIEVMWGAERPVCLALSITEGVTNAASLEEVDEAICALVRTGAMAPLLWFEDGTPPPGETERIANLDLSLLDFTLAMVEPNARDVIEMATVTEGGVLCLDMVVSGGATDTAFGVTASTDACVSITSITSSVVSLYLPAVDYEIELSRTAGSVIAPTLTAGTTASVRLSAEDGRLGAFSLQPSELDHC